MSPRLLGHGIAFAALLLAALLSAGEHLAIPWAVAGRSMQPALWPGDRLLIDIWTLRHRPPRIGELVLFEGPSGRPLVKRLARPPRLAPAYPDLWEDQDAPAERGYWVLGDNPELSRDSRQFGLVPPSRIRGRVVARYWPPFVRTSSPQLDASFLN